MPFKSKAQQRFLFAKKPKVAREFSTKTPDFLKLPEKASPKPPVSKGRKIGFLKKRKQGKA